MHRKRIRHMQQPVEPKINADLLTLRDRIKQIVLTREGQVRGSGIAGVPGYLVNRRLLIVGAQNADNIVNAFDRAMFGEGTDSLLSPALH